MGCIEGNTIKSEEYGFNVNSYIGSKLCIDTEFRNDNENVTYMKLVIQRFREYDYVSPDTQVAQICTMLTRLLIEHTHNSAYINFCIKRVRNSIGRLSSKYAKPYYSGKYVQSIQVKVYDNVDNILKIVNENINYINSKLESCKLIQVHFGKNIVLPSDMNVFVGYISREITKDLQDRYLEWINKDKEEVEILEPDNRASIKLLLVDKKYRKKDLFIKISNQGSKWVVCIIAKTNFNPYLWVKKLYNKVTIQNIYQNSYFMVYDTCREGSNLCKVCGENGIISNSSEKELNICYECLHKSLMNNILK